MTSKKNEEQGSNLEAASNKEYEEHMVSVFGRYATNAQSVINLMENGQYIIAWKKMQGMRDAMVYYRNATENRIKGENNESFEK